MPDSAARTVVAFDHYPLWLIALEQLAVEADLRFLGTSTDPVEALELVKRMQPAMLVAGTDDAEGETFQTVVEARHLAPAMKIVVMSRLSGEAAISGALAAGADMYILKTAVPADLAAAMRQALEPTFFVAALARVEPNALFEPLSLSLTRREREILRLVAEGHRNATLAARLWVSEQTVKFHLSNVYRKIGVSNRTEASRWAQVHGLLGEVSRPTDASN